MEIAVRVPSTCILRPVKAADVEVSRDDRYLPRYLQYVILGARGRSSDQPST